jgi:P-type conjugative transfer protein TrbL
MIWLEMGVLLTAFLIVLGSFFVLAIQLFVTLIEFKLTTLAGFVLVPFGLFGPTAFLAERVLGNVVASGIKILVLAVIIGIGTNLFSQFTHTAQSQHSADSHHPARVSGAGDHQSRPGPSSLSELKDLVADGDANSPGREP